MQVNPTQNRYLRRTLTYTREPLYLPATAATVILDIYRIYAAVFALGTLGRFTRCGVSPERRDL